MSLLWEEIKSLNFANYCKENIDPQHFFEKMSYQNLYSDLLNESSGTGSCASSFSSSFEELNNSFASTQAPAGLSRSQSMNIEKGERNNEKLFLSHYMRTPSADQHTVNHGVFADKTMETINVISLRDRKSEPNFISLDNIPQAMKKPAASKKKHLKLKMHLDEFYQTPFDDKMKERFSDCFHGKEFQQMA